jgi:hypothetical protein
LFREEEEEEEFGAETWIVAILSFLGLSQPLGSARLFILSSSSV